MRRGQKRRDAGGAAACRGRHATYSFRLILPCSVEFVAKHGQIDHEKAREPGPRRKVALDIERETQVVGWTA